jgi:hypothetical protein
VTFINNDDKPHVMMSSPEYLHTDCPATNAVNYLFSGQRKETAPFDTARDCGYHDHFNEFMPAWRGVIKVIAPAPAVLRAH